MDDRWLKRRVKMEINEREYNTILKALEIAELTVKNSLESYFLNDGDERAKFKAQLQDFKNTRESLIAKNKMEENNGAY